MEGGRACIARPGEHRPVLGERVRVPGRGGREHDEREADGVGRAGGRLGRFFGWGRRWCVVRPGLRPLRPLGVGCVPANQSLKTPTTQGATMRLNMFATSSDTAMNILRIWQGARLLSNPKQGPM